MRAILERLSPPNSRSSFTDETTNRLNRFDRLPFMLDRWRGMMSIGVFITEKELTLSPISSSDSFQNRESCMPSMSRRTSPRRILRFTPIPMALCCTIHRECTLWMCYETCPLRAFPPLTSCWSMQTSSCLDPWRRALMDNRDLLSNHRSMLVMPLFDYLNHTHLDRCFAEGLCDELYCSMKEGED